MCSSLSYPFLDDIKLESCPLRHWLFSILTEPATLNKPFKSVDAYVDHSCFLQQDSMCLVTQLCPALCDPMDRSPQAPLSMGTLQARILEWVAMPSSRGSSQPRIKPRSPALQADSLPSESPGKPRILEGVAYPFRGSSGTRNPTRVSCVAGRFFTS